MGIQGLLRNLHPLLVAPPSHSKSQNEDTSSSRAGQLPPPHRNKPAVRHNIRQFSGRSLAIDASSWLHKAGYSCAERLVESTESGTRDAVAERTYSKYMINRCDELLNWAGVASIILVFDGIRVPLKSGTNAERESKRKANLSEARRLKAAGKRNEAEEKYRACVKGNDEMARVVAGEVERRYGRDSTGTHRSVRVKCVWSPYEADAQLAKLCVDGWADAVVTEDSDLLVYSAVTRKPFPVITKLDRKDGACDVITMDWLVNPAFLKAMNNGSGESRSRRRRRRRECERDLDYIYNDSPLVEEEERERKENGNKEVEDGKTHYSEVEYDDLGLAPVRRALASPLSSSGGKSSSRGRRRGSSGSSDGNAGGNTLLSYLRSFANKEASIPGAGVRLFVQACVLSGCDYAPNRLSKVGPVTAFKLVKEALHREPAIRFERVLKSLPAGSKLIAEAGAGRGSDDQEDADEDDFLSPPDNDRDAKQKYEELLSKSQAIFYYHLVKDLSTGEIVPLTGHHSESNRNEGESDLEAGESSRPCVDCFDQGLAFIGSAAEASKKKPKPLQPLANGHGSQGGRSHFPAKQPQLANYHGCWMSSNRRDSGAVDNVTYRNQPRQAMKPVSATTALPPEETFLQKYLKRQPKKTTKGVRMLSSNNSWKASSHKSVGAVPLVSSTKSRGSAHSGGASLPASKRKPLHISTGASLSTSDTKKARMKPNQFASFAHTAAVPTMEENETTKKKSPLPASGCAADKALNPSPMFSPVKFDYGGYTPPPWGSSSSEARKSLSKPNSPVNNMDRTRSQAATTGNALTFRSVDLLHNDDEDAENEKQRDDESVMTGGKSEKRLNKPTATSSISHDDAFDYGTIVEESPPKKASTPRGFVSSFIRQTKSTDDDDVQPEPRRVSTSPLERSRVDDEQAQRGYSLEDVIDLSHDNEESNEEYTGVAASSSKSTGNNENHPNCSSQEAFIKYAPKLWKSSVNKQHFKSPYPKSRKGMTEMKTKASLRSINKTSRTSSSALLAGFARQESAAAQNRSSAKRKSRFFPPSSVDKRPKVTLKDFMNTSDKN